MANQLTTAFNSALVILGILWVSREESITGKTMESLEHKSRPYPYRAIAALLKLDSGNRMIDRCRIYLERFTNTLNVQSESTFLPSSSTTSTK